MGTRQMSSPAQYIKGLLERTKSFRISSMLSRDQLVAELNKRVGNDALSVPTYKKWELRTPIPHAYIIPFCEVVGADPYFLLTGKPFKLGKIAPSMSNPGTAKQNAA